MRVVLDTNILVSALIAPTENPAAIYNAWEPGNFTLLTCTEHLDEVRATVQNPEWPISSSLIGQVDWSIRSRSDNYLLAPAEAGRADYLLTGDKSGLLVLAHLFAAGAP
jgi:predicted nucleic acid-binding protein